MSQWTHVAGIFRVDALIINEEVQKETIKEIKGLLGKIVDFGDDDDWNTLLPCGSEGSLKYEVIPNPSLNSLSAFTIPVWGDLRDYDNVDEIISWFEGVCRNLWIRQAIIEIDVEGQDPVVHRYEQE